MNVIRNIANTAVEYMEKLLKGFSSQGKHIFSLFHLYEKMEAS